MKMKIKAAEDLLENRFKNIKTGGIYCVTLIATNTTNAQDGQTMVLYRQVDASSLLDRSTLYCCEYYEFMQKFEKEN